MALLSPVRNAAFALFFVAILAYGASFAWHLLINFDLLDLIYEVNSDDSFYYFKIAQYLAEGKFSTFDGGITRTNGYHPIWLLLITPFYWVFGSVQALFAIKAFEILLVAGGAALIALAARLAHLPWILLIGVLPPLYMAGGRGLIMGLEAAAALFWLGLLFLALVLWARKPARWFWLLAAVLLSLPWVRLEFAAVSFAAAGALWLLGGSQDGDAPRVARLKPMLAAAAGLLACFAWNWLAFGGPVPTSGLVRRAWSVHRWEEEGGYSLERNLQETLQIHAFDDELPVTLGICVVFLLLLWLARRFWRREYWPLLAFLVGAFSVAAGHLGKFVQTVLIMHPIWGNYVHYFVPGYLMMVLAAPVGCCAVLGILHGFLGARRPWVVKWLSQGIVLAGVLYLVAVVDFTEPFRYVQMRTQHSSGEEWRDPEYPAALIMNRLLPEGSVVGSWDAGILGYFSHVPVVNLDGVVNSYDYFHATLKTKDRYEYWRVYPQLVQQFGITHFTNRLPTSISTFDNEWYRHIFNSILFTGPAVPLGFGRWAVNLWPNFPPQAPPVQFDAAAWLWQRLAPHADYQSDKVTVIVDGRMAQAFVRDCASGQMPHALALSWDLNDRRNGLTRYLSAEGENSLGYCARAYLLPKDAAGPVSAEALPLTEFMDFIRGNGQRLVRSVFDIYSKDGQLTYIKEPCASADIAHSYFLHVWPLHANDLPEERKQHGFDNHDFPFDLYGRRFDGKCIATVSLPNYPIARILTGQYSEAGKLWIAEIR